nr:MAG TPA: hypothetical protein [Bacteriophage sp.]
MFIVNVTPLYVSNTILFTGRGNPAATYPFSHVL